MSPVKLPRFLAWQLETSNLLAVFVETELIQRCTVKMENFMTFLNIFSLGNNGGLEKKQKKNSTTKVFIHSGIARGASGGTRPGAQNPPPNLRQLGAPPPDPRVVTPAYHYNFAKFISSTKFGLLPSKKNNFCFQIFASIFHLKLCSFC